MSVLEHQKLGLYVLPIISNRWDSKDTRCLCFWTIDYIKDHKCNAELEAQQTKIFEIGLLYIPTEFQEDPPEIAAYNFQTRWKFGTLGHC